jgi:hypothetical protein
LEGLSAFGIVTLALSALGFGLECIGIVITAGNTATFGIEEDCTAIGGDFVLASEVGRSIDTVYTRLAVSN